MKVKVKFNHWLPKLIGFDSITIYPWIMTRFPDLSSMGTELLQHEFIHIRQVRKIGWFKFYLTYLYYSMKFSYKDIPYEVEAYSNQSTIHLSVGEIWEVYDGINHD